MLRADIGVQKQLSSPRLGDVVINEMINGTGEVRLRSCANVVQKNSTGVFFLGGLLSAEVCTERHFCPKLQDP